MKHCATISEGSEYHTTDDEIIPVISSSKRVKKDKKKEKKEKKEKVKKEKKEKKEKKRE